MAEIFPRVFHAPNYFAKCKFREVWASARARRRLRALRI